MLKNNLTFEELKSIFNDKDIKILYAYAKKNNRHKLYEGEMTYIKEFFDDYFLTFRTMNGTILKITDKEFKDYVYIY